MRSSKPLQAAWTFPWLGVVVLLHACGGPPAKSAPASRDPVERDRTGSFDESASGPMTPRRTGCLPEMVRIPGGDFVMGCSDGASDERPSHRVHVRTFCLDLDEVIADEYAACVAAGRCSEVEGACAATDAEREAVRLPRNCVSLEQAQTYCEQLGARLPTEAEWEYAARGGAREWAYPVGMQAPSAREACMDRSDGPCDIRSFPPEVFGLHDLSGNVREWVADPYQPYLLEGEGPSCDCMRALARGGSWQDQWDSGLRSAARHGSRPEPDRAIGFRCARDSE